MLASSLWASSPFDATKDLAAAAGGRIRPLESAAQLWQQDPETEVLSTASHPFSDGSSLSLLWISHLAEKQPNQMLYNELEALQGNTPQQIAQILQSKYPFAERLKQAGSTLLMLPVRLQENIWVSLHALELKVYDPESGRFVLAGNFTRFSDDQFQEIRAAYFSLIAQVSKQQQDAAAEAAKRLTEALGAAYDSVHADFPPRWLLKLEGFFISWPWIDMLLLFYAAGLLLFCFPSLRLSAFLLLFSGYLVHTALLLVRSLILQRPPVANMFETVLYVPWIALTLGAAGSLLLRTQLLLIASSIAAFLLLFLLKLSYPYPQLENVQAVLNSPYWLTIHVLMVVGSYGAFALAGVLGHYYLLKTAFFSRNVYQNVPIAHAILYSMYAGVTLLIPGTILGGVWAAESWGRFWDWDPKESWAFISASVYLLIIHAYRFRRIAETGLAIGSILGLMAISFTWYGVNYILGTGLHSYGFGNGGEWVYALYLLAESLFVGVTGGCCIRKKNHA